jgi:hypothetical protein
VTTELTNTQQFYFCRLNPNRKAIFIDNHITAKSKHADMHIASAYLLILHHQVFYFDILCKMASPSSAEICRNPLKEDLDIETLMKLGAVQPKGCMFKTTSVLVSGRIKNLKFQEAWYNGRPWLEYSPEDDAACCFFCRVFRPNVNGWLFSSVNLHKL